MWAAQVPDKPDESLKPLLMSFSLDRLRSIAVTTYREWRADRTLRIGAGLAYYGLFAVIPLLSLTAALAEWLFGTTEIRDYLAERMSQIGIVDADAAGAAISEELSQRSVQSSLGIIGVASLVVASSLLFVAINDAFNVIWHVPVGSGMWNTVRRRLVAFLMVLGAGAVLVASFAVSAVSGAAQALLPGDVRLLEDLADLLTVLGSWMSLAVALALLFHFLSPPHVPWRIAGFTAILTAVMLSIGTAAIAWFVRRYGGSSVTGALGAVLAVLTWIYYEAQILLGGAQLTKVLASIDELPSDRQADPPR